MLHFFFGRLLVCCGVTEMREISFGWKLSALFSSGKSHRPSSLWCEGGASLFWTIPSQQLGDVFSVEGDVLWVEREMVSR